MNVIYQCNTCQELSVFDITDAGVGLKMQKSCVHMEFTRLTRKEKKACAPQGVNPWDRKTNKTHCKHGHPYSGDNLRIDKATGYRVCRACRNNDLKKWRKNHASIAGHSTTKFNKFDGVY